VNHARLPILASRRLKLSIEKIAIGYLGDRGGQMAGGRGQMVRMAGGDVTRGIS